MCSISLVSDNLTGGVTLSNYILVVGTYDTHSGPPSQCLETPILCNACNNVTQKFFSLVAERCNVKYEQAKSLPYVSRILTSGEIRFILHEHKYLFSNKCQYVFLYFALVASSDS